MDDERAKALEMTKNELEARWAAGRPAEVRRRPDFAQTMHGVMEATAQHSEDSQVVVATEVVNTAGWFAASAITVETESANAITDRPLALVRSGK